MPAQIWKLAEIVVVLIVSAVIVLLLNVLGNALSPAPATLAQSFSRWLVFVQRSDVIATAVIVAVVAGTKDWWWPSWPHAKK